jgi:uncharacterized protein GlcG (DUF336 family)
MRKTAIRLGIVLTLAAVPLAGHAQAEPTLDDCAAVAASAAIGLAETYVEGLIRTMVVLAATAPVQAADWDEMFTLLETFQEASLPMATWFVLPDGSYHTVDGGAESANVSDRVYFPIVMSGRIATGHFVVSRSTGRLSMVTAVPVASDGQVVGALGVSLFLDTFSSAIAEDLALPDGIIFYAATPEGQIALHSDPKFLQADVSEAGLIVEDTATAVSRLLGWTFGVGPAD